MFALEHGLDRNDLAQITVLLHARLRGDGRLSDHWLVWVIYAAEQGYVRELGEGGARLDFFSPIPDWARRRLSTIGEQAVPSASLLSFVVSGAELETEEKFLHDYLFLNRTAA